MTHGRSREKSLQKYRQDLRKTLLLGELISCLAFITGYTMVLNLLRFTKEEAAFINPLLSLFILAAAILLFIVASTSMLETSRLMGEEDRRERVSKIPDTTHEDDTPTGDDPFNPVEYR